MEQYFSQLLVAREETSRMNEQDDLALELETRHANETFNRDRESIDAKQALFERNQSLRREAVADQHRKSLKNFEFSLLNKS